MRFFRLTFCAPALIMFMALCGVLRADITGFTVEPDKTRLAMGEQMIVTVTLVSNKDLGRVAPPALPENENFSVLKVTQNQSSSSSIQIINGQTSKKNEITYSFFYFCTPKKMGTFTFPALQLPSGNQTVTSKPFEVVVSNEQVRNPDVRVLVSLSSKNLVVGQQAILTITVAQKVQSAAQLTDQGFMGLFDNVEKSLGGTFSLYRLFGNSLKSGNDQIGGEAHRVYTVRYAVFALNPGTATIPQLSYDYIEQKRVAQQRRVDPFFDDFFFGGGVQQVPKTALSIPVTVNVSSLPDAPKGFSGAVGTFAISATVSKNQVATGDAVTLTITLKGSTRPNSMPDIAAPDIRFAELFTPEKQTWSDTTDQGIVSRKTFKYMIIPKEEGTQTIPPISYTYYDPAEKSHKTIATQPFELLVTKGKTVAQTQSRYLTQEDIQLVGNDIRYIKTDVHLTSQHRAPYKNPLFLVLYPIPFILAVFALLYRIQAVRKQKNAEVSRKMRALRNALRTIEELTHAKQPLANNELCSALVDSIETYITNRFGFAAAGKTMLELQEALMELKVPPSHSQRLVQFLEGLDRYRFGGHTLDVATRGSLASTAEKLLRDFEKSFAGKRSA